MEVLLKLLAEFHSVLLEHRQRRPGPAVDAASDAELVTRCRAGDRSAWEALVDCYARYVHAIVTRVDRLDPHDAEDASRTCSRESSSGSTRYATSTRCGRGSRRPRATVRSTRSAALVAKVRRTTFRNSGSVPLGSRLLDEALTAHGSL